MFGDPVDNGVMPSFLWVSFGFYSLFAVSFCFVLFPREGRVTAPKRGL